jgi:cell division protein FtsB
VSARAEEAKVSPIYQLAFVTALVLLFVVIAKLYMDGYLEIKRLEAKLAAEVQGLTEAKALYKRLEDEIALLKTDEGMEMVARDKLRFIRPDEVVVMPLR